MEVAKQPTHSRRRGRRRRLWQVPIAIGAALLVAVCMVAGAASGPQAAGSEFIGPVRAASRNSTARHLLQTPQTPVPGAPTEDSPLYPPDLIGKDARERGGFLLYVVGIFYMFWGLAIVCDDFFVPALEVITEVLDLSEDVAGATFMAAGGSAPELFTSLFGVFVAKSNVGFGTIVGSAVFNVLFVIGACAALTRPVAADMARKEFEETGVEIPWYHQGLPLTSWPLARDSVFYGIDLIVLSILFLDKKIYWYEALVLLVLYGCYVMFMKSNAYFHDKFLKWTGRVQDGPDEEVSCEDRATERRGSKIERRPSGGSIKHVARDIRRESRKSLHAASMEMDVAAAAKAMEKKEEGVGETPEAAEDDDDDGPWTPTSWPDEVGEQVKFVIAFPLNFALWLTVPNCQLEEKKPFFVPSFVLSIVWIAFFSYFMVWWADVLGDTLGIPPEVMGLTLLAAGTSVPDLITSVVVARAGKGDMAVSSSIGSNIFDIAFGLPLPWFLYTLLVNHGADPVDVESDALGSSVLMLFCMLLVTIGCIALFQWKLNVALGGTSVVLYVIFMTFTLLINYGHVSGL